MTAEYIVIHPRNIFSDEEANERFDIIDMYDLERTDLTPYTCMIVLNFVDQDYLLEQKAVIDAFLAAGKIVAFFGNLVTPWLEGQSMFIPKEIRWHGDYNISIASDHSIFDGVLEDDMTTNKGVKGFFARGHHEAPAHAEVLLTLPDGETVTYIDRTSTNGTIFMHAGGNLFRIGLGMKNQPTKTTDVIPARMEAWVDEEWARLKGAKINA